MVVRSETIRSERIHYFGYYSTEGILSQPAWANRVHVIFRRVGSPQPVIPAFAGIHSLHRAWIPAFAGMTQALAPKSERTRANPHKACSTHVISASGRCLARQAQQRSASARACS
jgi:hypothetical protein